MNYKHFAAALLTIAMIIMAGCDKEGEDTQTGPVPYIGGTKGLVVEFEPLGMEESGLYSIFEDETFPLQIILTNKGEYDVKAGEAKVTIQGIPLSDFSGIKTATLANKGSIEKISDLNKEGGEEILDFGQTVKYIQPIAGSFYDAGIVATYSYIYKTFASVPKVCFKEDLRDDRICDVEESKTVYSSAAPIQVQSVKESPAGSGLVSLEFTVENVGGGKSTAPGMAFSPQYDQAAYNIEPATEASKWTCISGGREGVARFATDGKAVIRCKLVNPLEKGALYTKQIGLTMSYEYRDLIQETVRIKKAI